MTAPFDALAMGLHKNKTTYIHHALAASKVNKSQKAAMHAMPMPGQDCKPDAPPTRPCSVFFCFSAPSEVNKRSTDFLALSSFAYHLGGATNEQCCGMVQGGERKYLLLDCVAN